MNSSKGCFLVQTRNGWQVASVDADEATFHHLDCKPDVSPEALAQAVTAFVNEQGLRSRNIVLGVHATSALAGNFESDAEDQRSRQTLEYGFENVLPCAAEEIVSDFVCSGRDVFGVAISMETWLPIVIELETQGFQLQSISPVAVMAMQSYLDRAESHRPDLVCWQDQESYDLFNCHENVVTQWWHWNEGLQAAKRQLVVATLGKQEMPTCDLVNVTGDVSDLGSGLIFQNIDTPTLADHAYRTARRVLEGTESSRIELRREELAAGDPNRALRRPLQFLFAALVIFLVAMGTAFWVKNIQFERSIRALEAAQISEFKKAFPGARVPGAVVSRLRSERAKISGSRRGKSDVELPLSALHVLYEFLSALPENKRYLFRECRIEDGKLDLDVELRSHNDANSLAGGLEDRGFFVSAPATVQQEQKSVSSRIFADIRSPEAGQGL